MVWPHHEHSGSCTDPRQRPTWRSSALPSTPDADVLAAGPTPPFSSRWRAGGGGFCVSSGTASKGAGQPRWVCKYKAAPDDKQHAAGWDSSPAAGSYLL